MRKLVLGTMNEQSQQFAAQARFTRDAVDHLEDFSRAPTQRTIVALGEAGRHDPVMHLLGLNMFVDDYRAGTHGAAAEIERGRETLKQLDRWAARVSLPDCPRRVLVLRGVCGGPTEVGKMISDALCRHPGRSTHTQQGTNRQTHARAQMQKT